MVCTSYYCNEVFEVFCRFMRCILVFYRVDLPRLGYFVVACRNFVLFFSVFNRFKLLNNLHHCQYYIFILKLLIFDNSLRFSNPYSSSFLSTPLTILQSSISSHKSSLVFCDLKYLAFAPLGTCHAHPCTS
jgi:hypothetical protein